MEGISRTKKYGAFALVGAITFPMWKHAFHPVWHGEKRYGKDRTAIVTGASGNLGLSITRQLAMRNVRVIMACKDMEKCRMERRQLVLMTGNKGIVCRQLDLENIDSINRFAKEMKDTEPHIDILINNAAVKYVKQREITKYGVEKNYFVNFLAPFLLTFLLMDKLKESSLSTRDSRIINVIGNPKGSWDVELDDINFDKRKYSPDKAYKQSKLALAYFTILLDQLHRKEGNSIYVYGVSPGETRIDKSFYQPVTNMDQIKHFFQKFYLSGPERLIQPVIRCALDGNFANPARSGKLYCYFLTSFGWGKAAKDETKAKTVWNLASQLLLAPK